MFKSDYASNFFIGHKFSKTSLPWLFSAAQRPGPLPGAVCSCLVIRWWDLEVVIPLGDSERSRRSGKRQAFADRLNVSMEKGAPGGLQAFFTEKYVRLHSLWLLGETEVKQVFGGADRNFILQRHRQTLLDCQAETGRKEMGSRNSESSGGARG